MLKDVLFIAMQRILPAHFLSRLVGKLCDSKNEKLKNYLISKAMKRFQIELSEAVIEDPKAFPTFNAFFTRALKTTARPMPEDKNAFVSPCDGTISQLGPINHNRLFQAKGHEFNLVELLGGETDHANRFCNGQFMTIYLSPQDYHRVHMPFDGRLTGMTFVPGDLFSVNKVTAEHIPNLFARNERVVFFFDSPAGEFIVIMVGAMLVASIETPFAGIIAPGKGREIQHTSHFDQAIQLKKGDELGRFRFGSTVILLRPNTASTWSDRWHAAMSIHLNESLVTEA